MLKALRATKVHACLLAVFALLALGTVLAAAPVGQAYASSTATPMYRMYNANSGEHFYTADGNERDMLIKAGWSYEGVGWTAPKSSSTPVYRLYSGTDHHYTTAESERDTLASAGWSYEGVGWFSDDSKQVALYRQFNPNVNPRAARNNSGSHNYTASQAENDSLVKLGWKAEGVAWYGIPAAHELLDLVNSARSGVGAQELAWNKQLEQAAKIRAEEIVKQFSHTRPDGTSCFTAISGLTYYTAGENIAAGQSDAAAANTSWTNSPGHYANMISTSFNCMGAASFTVNGTSYWVELFAYVP